MPIKQEDFEIEKILNKAYIHEIFDKLCDNYVPTP